MINVADYIIPKVLSRLQQRSEQVLPLHLVLIMDVKDTSIDCHEAFIKVSSNIL